MKNLYGLTTALVLAATLSVQAMDNQQVATNLTNAATNYLKALEAFSPVAYDVFAKSQNTRQNGLTAADTQKYDAAIEAVKAAAAQVRLAIADAQKNVNGINQLISQDTKNKIMGRFIAVQDALHAFADRVKFQTTSLNLFDKDGKKLGQLRLELGSNDTNLSALKAQLKQAGILTGNGITVDLTPIYQWPVTIFAAQ